MSLKLVDYESLNGDVKKYHYAIRGQCRFLPDSGEREFRSILGPTGNKLQRKLPEMKLKKKKKKHMKSKYEKTKKLGTPASPTTTLKQRQTQKRKKLFVAQTRSQGITVCAMVIINPRNPNGQCLSEAKLREILRFCYDEILVLFRDEMYQQNIYKDETLISSKKLPDFSVVSNVFKKKQDSEQSTTELALEKDDDDDITVEQAWDDIVQRVEFLSADHPLGSHLRATLQRDGERHGSVHVLLCGDFYSQ
ncbi:BnaC03g61900D [Brassica napus]|uniref:Aminotransferase class I/classII large domain-containing protein n=2 Tax=Brassica TaxID=3705 RepID=A0A3P6BRH8_BRAOL|nr:unnamed protein product [Brassica napus]CDY35470.1 BnaC03g61900D [Brassica napus]VDC98861.1 unnamed protein product [Brassica oleracea]